MMDIEDDDLSDEEITAVLENLAHPECKTFRSVGVRPQFQGKQSSER